jgi:midasin (ATPase involved in ribosome maturation)
MRSVNIIMPDESNEITSSLMIETRDRTLKIGDVSMLINNPERPEMVPNPLFFEIPSHTRILQNMMRDLISGEKHLLLLGPQGCGKNKLSDKLCNLLKYEREYVQLHRDSTVGTLTLSPSLLDGKLIWEDSPLVRAVKNGYVLMVDEADKAPVEVEEMLLADGRRIVSSKHPLSNDKNSIVLHENFKMIVLANRPGFPFLGNNFFRDVGDIFPTHTIDNPDENSERKLLKKYGPNVKDEIIHKLASVFRDLRLETNTGKIQYPYSTREAVAIVKHLDKYSQDGVSSALEDVLSFDAFDSTLREQLMAIFKRHGIPLKSNPFNNNAYEFNDETLTVNIAQKKKIQGAKKMGSWKVE